MKKNDNSNYKPAIFMDIMSSGFSVSEDTPITLSYNECLIKAVFHNEYEAVCQLLELDEFDNGILEDIGLFDVPFPLYFITMCYKQFMWYDYIEEIMPFVLEQRTKIDALLKLWKEKFNIDTEKKIDYKKYENEFFCFEDSETFEDIFDYPIERYLDAGCREIDLRLYEAVIKFHFDEVERLLEQGANPDADLQPSNAPKFFDPCNCLDFVGDECSFLSTCEVFPLIKEEHGSWYINYPISDEDVGHLIGLAAHNDMFSLLKSKISC